MPEPYCATSLFPLALILLLLPLPALPAIKTWTSWTPTLLHVASHEQPQTRCLVALVGAFTASPRRLGVYSDVATSVCPSSHQDMDIMDTNLFHTPPFMNNLGLDVWLLRWERPLPLLVDLVPLPT